MKPLLICCLIMCSGCQLQINLASNVINVPVIKAQVDNDKAEMTGSNLEDVKKGADKAGDVALPIP